jgi:hypothetical protein
VIHRRLVTASREIEDFTRYNYILVNDRLEDSTESLRAIVRAERLLRAGRPLSSDEAKVVALSDRCRLVNVGERLQPILASFRASATPGGASPR